MNKIPAEAYTMLSNGGRGYRTVLQISEDAGLAVGSYEELVDRVAKIAYRNARFTLYFRGQTKDYPEPYRGKTISSLFPSLWRLPPKKRTKVWKVLEAKVDALLASPAFEKSERRALRAIPERCWAILQHYGVDTPLLDVTRDLRVATTFAARDVDQGKDDPSGEEYGYVYVLGMPNSFEATTVSLDHGLVTMRLQSVCPVTARRPHFQSGYLVGSYPTRDVNVKHAYKNFSMRMIAKFRVSTKDTFWDVDCPVSGKALFPAEDPLRDEIAGLV